VIEVATGSFTADVNSASPLYILKADTWYHAFLIRRSDTGVVDVLFSDTPASPDLPTNYDEKRRIGAVLTDGSANIIKFKQVGDNYYWDVPVRDYFSSSPGTSAITTTLTVPTGLKVIAQFNWQFANQGDAYGLITSLDETDTTPSATVADLWANTSASLSTPSSVFERETDTSAQIRHRYSDGTLSKAARISTKGWIDPRGRNA
jgi:hypothetical protein